MECNWCVYGALCCCDHPIGELIGCCQLSDVYIGESTIFIQFSTTRQSEYHMFQIRNCCAGHLECDIVFGSFVCLSIYGETRFAHGGKVLCESLAMKTT